MFSGFTHTHNVHTLREYRGIYRKPNTHRRILTVHLTTFNCKCSSKVWNKMQAQCTHTHSNTIKRQTRNGKDCVVYCTTSPWWLSRHKSSQLVPIVCHYAYYINTKCKWNSTNTYDVQVGMSGTQFVVIMKYERRMTNYNTHVLVLVHLVRPVIIILIILLMANTAAIDSIFRFCAVWRLSPQPVQTQIA